MRFLKARFLVVGALITSALGLIGFGASAAFTDSVSATQIINTGTLAMCISSVDGNGVPDGVVSKDCKSVTWDLENSGSKINLPHTLTVTNTGTLPLTINSVTVSARGGGLDPAPLGDDVTWNINGFIFSVRQAESIAWTCGGCNLKPGGTLVFVNSFTGSLNNADEGQTIMPTIALGAVEWNGSASQGVPTLAPAA